MIKYKYSPAGLLTETQHFDKNFRQVATKKYSIKREKDGSVNLSAATYNDLNALQEGYTQVKDTQQGTCWRRARWIKTGIYRNIAVIRIMCRATL